MRWTVPRKRTASTSSVTAPPCRLPLIGEGMEHAVPPPLGGEVLAGHLHIADEMASTAFSASDWMALAACLVMR